MDVLGGTVDSHVVEGMRSLLGWRGVHLGQQVLAQRWALINDMSAQGLAAPGYLWVEGALRGASLA